jgi:DNA-binding winged helix-turn-helix (wHTH) protein
LNGDRLVFRLCKIPKKSLNSRTEQSTRWYLFGPFRIDPTERVLRRNGDLVPLTPKVFEMLLALVESRGRVVRKLDRLWPDVFVEEANLNVNMSILRRALGGERKHQYIETISKRGYRFVASVRELEKPRAGVGTGLSSRLRRGSTKTT